MWPVMLVDDEPAVLEGLRAHIDWEALGARVVAAASSGAEALTLFSEHSPAIVLTDIYMPGIDGLELMQRVHAQAPDTVFVVLSGYDDFENARRSLQIGAVDYLLKPATLGEMEEVIRRAIDRCEANQHHRRLAASLPALREHFLLRLLQADPDPAEAAFLGFADLLEGPFAVALIAPERRGEPPTERWQLTRLQIQAEAAGPGCYPLFSTGSEILVILHRPADAVGWCNQLFATLQERCEVPITIGLSRLCESVQTAGAQAQEALSYKAILGTGRVIALDQVAVDGDLVPPYQVESNRAVLEALRTGEEAAVAEQVRRVAARVEQAPLPYVRGVATELYALGVIALSERGLAADEDLPAAEFWPRVASAEMAALFDWLAGGLGAVASRLNLRRESRHERVLQAIDELIAVRYAEDLTLEEVARAVYLSRTYVAYLFKQVRGRSFLEHLTRFRMTKARELLLATDRSVYDIADAVGYRNQAYFSRLFKEQFGVMPSELRRAAQG